MLQSISPETTAGTSARVNESTSSSSIKAANATRNTTRTPQSVEEQKKLIDVMGDLEEYYRKHPNQRAVISGTKKWLDTVPKMMKEKYPTVIRESASGSGVSSSPYYAKWNDIRAEASDWQAYTAGIDGPETEFAVGVPPTGQLGAGANDEAMMRYEENEQAKRERKREKYLSEKKGVKAGDIAVSEYYFVLFSISEGRYWKS